MNMADNQINKNISDYLEYFVSLDNPQYAVLINGNWGCGKTYFIKKHIEKWNETNKSKSRLNRVISFFKRKKTDIQEENECIILKPIYISLFGLTTLDEVTIKIKTELTPLLYSKSAKFLKKFLFGVIKASTKINFDTNNDGKTDGDLSFNVDSIRILKSSGSNLIKGNKILIFDDLERCSIQLNDLFGYINEFVEHHSCKVIILTDERKIQPAITKSEKDTNNSENKAEKPDYKDFKEKLIGQTFSLSPDIDNAIVNFINDSNELKEFYHHNSNLLRDFFWASDIQNLRIFKQVLLDFERFVNAFDITIKSHKKFKLYQINLIAHFLIVYFEYKSGNRDIGKINQINYLGQKKDSIGGITGKYQEVLVKHKIDNWTLIFPYSSIIKFINNGYLYNNEINNYLKSSNFFSDLMIQDWERLWYWENLENEEFNNYFQKVSNEYNDGKIENMYVLLHVSGILLSLINNSIITYDKNLLVLKFKERIDQLFEIYKNETIMPSFHHSFNKTYRSNDDEVFKDLVAYFSNKITQNNKGNKNDYMKNIFENLNNDNITTIHEKLEAPLPDRSTSYSCIPMLETVDGAKLAECFLNLSNYNVGLFIYFLRKRYYPEETYKNGHLEPYVTKDIDCLISFRDSLKSKLNSLTLIRKYDIKSSIEFLNALIDKLQVLKNNNECQQVV